MGDLMLKAMPFDSNEILDPVTGETTFDREAKSRDLADWLRTYISNGILIPGGNVLGEQLKVVLKEALTCMVKVGAVCINGRTGWLQSAADVIVDMGGAQPRIDRIVAELNIPSDRGIYIKVLKGTPAASPAAPNLTQTEDVYQIPLAQIKVNASAAVIAEIVDERPNCISNVTIGIKPPTGMDAVTVLASSNVAQKYGIPTANANVDNILGILADAQLASILKDTVTKTWVVPTGVTKIRIFACAAGSGRNAGAYVLGTEYTVTPGQTMTFTVGTGNTIISGGGLSSAITLTAGSIAASLNHLLFGFNLGISGNSVPGATGNYGYGGYGGAFGAGGGGAGFGDNTVSNSIEGTVGGGVAGFLGGAAGVYNVQTPTAGGNGDKYFIINRLLKYLPDLLTSGGGGGAAAASGGYVGSKGGTSGSGNAGGNGKSSGSTYYGPGGGGGAGGYGAGAGLGGRKANGPADGDNGTPSPGMVLICYNY